MSGSHALFEVTRALLLPLVVILLAVVPFGGGCAVIMTFDLSSALAWMLIAGMVVSIVGNLLLFVFIVNATPPGLIAKIVMIVIAILDHGLAVAAAIQKRESGLIMAAIAAVLFVKGLLTFIFAFIDRPDPDGSPPFPPLHP